MIRIIQLILTTATLCSCSSVPAQTDPFETAIQSSMGAMMGGIMGTNEGGVQ